MTKRDKRPTAKKARKRSSLAKGGVYSGCFFGGRFYPTRKH
jgi:hypothetical protein